MSIELALETPPLMPHTTLRPTTNSAVESVRGLEEVDEYAATHDTDYGVGSPSPTSSRGETSTKAIDAISESHHRGVTYWTHPSTTSVATEPSMSAKCGSR